MEELRGAGIQTSKDGHTLTKGGITEVPDLAVSVLEKLPNGFCNGFSKNYYSE